VCRYDTIRSDEGNYDAAAGNRLLAGGCAVLPPSLTVSPPVSMLGSLLAAAV
jgi:hypothetical protein